MTIGVFRVLILYGLLLVAACLLTVVGLVPSAAGELWAAFACGGILALLVTDTL